MKRLMLSLGLLSLIGCSTSAGACEGLAVNDAWIREAPPGVDTLAGYATLKNTGSKALSIDSAKSTDFASVVLHETMTMRGHTHMMKAPKIDLAPGKSLEISPGGYHLMMSKPTRVLKAGDTVKVDIGCGGASQSVSFSVRKGE